MGSLKPGLYRHFKGGLYRLLFLANDTTNVAPNGHPAYVGMPTNATYCVYISLESGHIYIRQAAQWTSYACHPEALDQENPRPQDLILRFDRISD